MRRLSENGILSLKHEGEFMNMDGCSEMIWTHLQQLYYLEAEQ